MGIKLRLRSGFWCPPLTQSQGRARPPGVTVVRKQKGDTPAKSVPFHACWLHTQQLTLAKGEPPKAALFRLVILRGSNCGGAG